MDRIDELLNKPRFTPGTIQYSGFKIDYTDSVSLYWELKDIFEEEIYRFSCSNDKPMIIDAGGCIGVSVLYFKKLFPNAKVLVFEPDPDILKVLLKNIEQNELTDVQIINCGLGSENSQTTFFGDGLDGGSVFANVNGNKIEKKVDIVKLSDYVDGPVDFLKMNIEGLETDVIREVEPKLNHIREIVFEYHNFHNLPQGLGEILTILDRSGYRYIVSTSTSCKIPIPFRLKETYRYFNLVYATRLN